MPKICYVSKRFNASSLAIIQQANLIIEEYEAQGFDLTLRQLFYQFVSRDLLPNRQQSYKRLGNIINDARLAGLVDWERLVDRTRYLRKQSHWENPAGVIKSAMDSYALDKWAEQDHRPEVWIEKDALVGVIEGVCEELDVPYFSCRGYVSASEMWAAACRMLRYRRSKQRPVIFHLGDHDPSGVQMTEDIRNRLNQVFGCDAEIHRIALTREQIDEFNPPPNPAKETDARFASYAAVHGTECWELDALDPATLASVIRGAILDIRDEDIWAEVEEREQRDKAGLLLASDHWDDVAAYLHAQHGEEEP
jgi:hypothetical protein